MTAKNSSETAQNYRRSDTALDRKYGEIGISAVAAALKYQGETKNSDQNSTLVPATSRHDEERIGIAA